MGEVYRAEHAIAGRDVAIKLLRSELADDHDFGQRFFHEAQAVNRIRHPNIVDVLDAGVGEAGPYIVMEYLEGESVSAALRRTGRFDADAAIATTIPILEALQAAHRMGIIHRDLKPENAFFAQDPTGHAPVVRLLDFGIAKLMTATGHSPRTRTGIVFGTPDYLSPEQATGEPLLDGRSDLFTIGVLLFELLTGRRPFSAPSAVATAFKVVHADAPTLESMGVRVDPKLEGIVQRLLEKDPVKRFPTAADVAHELDQLLPHADARAAALLRIKSSSERTANRSSRSSHSQNSLVRPTLRATGDGATIPPGHGHAPNPTPVPRRGTGSQPTLPSVRQLSEDPGPTPISQRALPAHLAGKYQVRGPVLRGMESALIATSSALARDRVVAQLPKQCAADFHGGINALILYDLETLNAFMEVATALVLQDVAQWRELGRQALTELEPTLRATLQPAKDLSTAARRGVHGWSRLLDFGEWHVRSDDTSTILHLTGFEPAPLALRLWLVGLVEETLRRVIGPTTRVTIMSGEAAFAPELICKLH
jgi:serine/threonine-protein kinase